MNDDELGPLEDAVRRALDARAERTPLRHPSRPVLPSKPAHKRARRAPLVVTVAALAAVVTAVVLLTAGQSTADRTRLRVDSPPAATSTQVTNRHPAKRSTTPVRGKGSNSKRKKTSRCLRVGATVATTVALATGCGSSGHDQSSPTTSPTTTPVTSVATTTPTTSTPSTSTTSPPTTAPATTTTTTTTVPVKTSPCSAADLTIAYAGDEGAQGVLTYFFKATNTGSATCNVEGYFGYSDYTKSGTRIGSAGTPSGLTWNFTAYKDHLIEVKPGAVVWTAVMSGDDTGGASASSCSTGAYWELIPPNTTVPERVTGASYPCTPLRIFGTLTTAPSGL
jgi:Protein of unknown function (DUF4232)